MNCPYCQSELPLGHSGACPNCGKPLAPPENSLVQPALPVARINWLVFFSVLLAPPLLTILTARAGHNTEGVAIGIALIGGGLAGIVCGVMLGRRWGNTVQTRIALGLLFAGVLAAVCIGTSCFGCLASGYHMDFK